MTKSTQAARDRAWLAVNLGNLAANAAQIRDTARGARLLPMIKADGYGLGAVPVARTLERAVDPWGFGVATVSEGAALRAASISRPVVVFTPARPDQQDAYRKHDLRAVLDAPAVIAGWDLPYHLEVDTGMGRSGARWDEPDLARYRTSRLEGTFFHFHSAEDNPASVTLQWTRFQQALRTLGVRPPAPAAPPASSAGGTQERQKGQEGQVLLHAANSAGIFHFDVALDLVRPGIFLYGCCPSPDVPAPRPVASLHTRVVSLRVIRRGESVSYGAEWVAARDSTIATLGIGYADGLPRCLQGKLMVLINGRRFPVVARITMDMVMADLGPDGGHGVRAGDIVTVVGFDGGEEITWDDLAGWAGTNTYEMMCRLGSRVERVYRDG